jgi:hypothetical protein
MWRRALACASGASPGCLNFQILLQGAKTPCTWLTSPLHDETVQPTAAPFQALGLCWRPGVRPQGCCSVLCGSNNGGRRRRCGSQLPAYPPRAGAACLPACANVRLLCVISLSAWLILPPLRLPAARAHIDRAPVPGPPDDTAAEVEEKLLPADPAAAPAAQTPAPAPAPAAEAVLQHPPGFVARRLVVFAGILLGCVSGCLPPEPVRRAKGPTC